MPRAKWHTKKAKPVISEPVVFAMSAPNRSLKFRQNWQDSKTLRRDTHVALEKLPVLSCCDIVLRCEKSVKVQQAEKKYTGWIVEKNKHKKSKNRMNGLNSQAVPFYSCPSRDCFEISLPDWNLKICCLEQSMATQHGFCHNGFIVKKVNLIITSVAMDISNGT